MTQTWDYIDDTCLKQCCDNYLRGFAAELDELEKVVCDVMMVMVSLQPMISNTFAQDLVLLGEVPGLVHGTRIWLVNVPLWKAHVVGNAFEGVKAQFSVLATEIVGDSECLERGTVET
jgi:hypothetical protein